MADNIESWSRTRRASAHSITMSSSNSSRASSIGPSSFTENLTLYMNGGREYIPASANLSTGEPPNQSGNAQAQQSRNDFSDVQTLKDELQAALNRHEELMSENARLSEELKQSIASNQKENYPTTMAAAKDKSDLIRQEDYDQVKAQNAQLKKKLEEATAGQSNSHELRTQLAEANHTTEELGLKVEAVRQQADVHLLRSQELESQLEEQAKLLKKSQDREADSSQQIRSLQQDIENLETNGRDELDDQSLIEELEDDLERTRHELERVIKDKRRAERQVEFVQSDLKFERSRNEELVEQIAQARDSKTLPKGASPGISVGNSNNPEPNDDIRRLSDEIGRTSMRIETLETKLADAISAKQNLNKASQTFVPHAGDKSEDRTIEQGTAAVERAEAYIRKFKSQEKGLNADLKDAQLERDDLRLQLRESEDAYRVSLKTVEELRREIRSLKDVKERMGRVLMYQWGKEEVGEVERDRNDGLKERGMGYRYKYFNKDGSVKQNT